MRLFVLVVAVGYVIPPIIGAVVGSLIAYAIETFRGILHS